ncbi:hypothetical protein [Mycobacterium sp. SMC-4]|nr:hypothetical protein [Mycobacterium sp. SMC-4]UXA18354.1 hypothetical protein KXD98_01060 [Mycobacterium sp. SMC-4]
MTRRIQHRRVGVKFGHPIATLIVISRAWPSAVPRAGCFGETAAQCRRVT